MQDKLANPFRRDPEAGGGARRPSPPPSNTPREFVRLYVMGLVFLMALAGLIYTQRVIREKPAPKPKTGEIDYTVRRDLPGGAPQDPAAPEQAIPKEKKSVALQALPKDGQVDFKALAEPFRDGMEKPVKETPEFVALLRTLLTSVTPDMLEKRVVPGTTADAAYLQSAQRRGDVVRVYGQLTRIYTEPLETTIPENATHVYLGIMTEFGTNRTVTFYMPELPRDPKTGELIRFDDTRDKKGETFFRNWVTIEGVFLRRYDYESQMEDREGRPLVSRSALLFVGRGNLELATPPQIANARTGFIVIVTVIAVLVVAIVIVAGVMSRRYGGDALREKRMAAAKARLPKPAPEKQLLGAQIPPSSGPPGQEPGAGTGPGAGDAGAVPPAPTA
ncbi:MAG TPA: hypothetical protein VEJ18_07965 [Planctomycetota bacterium]|nr:hypothetical protein [Planctomycetota bacterium]